MKFHLHAEVTVSAYTVVIANSLKEAIQEVEDRPVVWHSIGTGTDENEEWCVSEMDGSAVNIRTDIN